MLEFKNVSLQYVKDYFALCSVNFKFEKGKMYNIVGETGSGRASLLRCIAQLEKKYEGSIEYDSKNIQELDYSKDLGVGLVTEIPVFLDKKDIVENLEYVSRNRELTKNSEEEKYLITQIIKSFELDYVVGIKVKKLDYFTKQKISLARLSMRNVDILLVENIFDLINEEQIYEIKNYLEKYFINENAIIILASSYELTKYFSNIEIVEISAGLIKEK